MARKKKKKEDELTIETTGSHTIVHGDLESVKRHLEKIADRNQRMEVIKKVQLIDGRRLKISFMKKTRSGVDKDNKECSAPIHPDLRNAFAVLNEHLGRLCFQPITEHNPLHKDNKELPALICPIHCTGFSITGSDDTEAVTLHGFRTLPNAKEIGLESPSQRWNGDVYDEYEEIEELSEAIMTCIGEVELYLFPSAEWPDCKVEPDNQLSLFPEDEEEDE